MMKETNPWETQLRSWRPRRASARLKRRLFGAAEAAGASRAPHAHGAAWFLGPLAPAAVCALLTLGIFDSRTEVPGAWKTELVASNLNSTAIVLDGFAEKQNHWSSVTFDSTNRSGLGFNMDSFRH